MFAIDVGIAKHWWVKPFLGFDPRHGARSDQADGDPHADQRGEGRRALVIFPEGRITVTGSLMKVYDGAGLIADKSDAMVVPVRHRRPGADLVQRLSRSAGAPQVVPEVQGDGAGAGEADGRSRR